MDKSFALIVNGRHHTVTTDPARPLLHVLREDLKLTGTKYGCGEGQCGACTVLIGGERNHACLLPIQDVAGRPITTIEGLADGDGLHPVQAAFLEEAAMQCGFCTSGMILSATALLNQRPKPDRAEIRSWMNAQICRCGSYPQILKAVERAATQGGRNV